MLIRFRSFLQGIFGKVIMLMIVATLSVFGFGAFTVFTNTDNIAAVVNGDDISERALRNQIDRYRQRVAGEENASELLARSQSPEFVDQTLDSLINQKLLEQAAVEYGLVASEMAVDQGIRTLPDFQIEGEYEPELFRETLQATGMSAQRYRSEFESFLLRSQLMLGVAGTNFVTKPEFERALSLGGESRDIAWLPVKWKPLAVVIEISDEQVAEYYQSFMSNYELPERIVVEYLKLDETQMVAQMDVPEEDIQSAYEAEKSEFVPNEERRSAHILIRTNDERDEEAVMALAETVHEKLLAGAGFAEMVKEYSDDEGTVSRGGDLGWAARGQFVPPFEEALFALQEGDISEPVKTSFGVHIIKLFEVRGAEFDSYDAIKGRIRLDIAEDLAAEQFAEQSRQLAEISYESSDLQAASDALSLPVERSEPLTRDDAEGVFATPVVIAAIYSEDVLEQGYNSALLEPEAGVAMVVRLAEKQPARQQSLEEVRDEIVETLRKERALQNARVLADAAIKRLLEGGDKEVLAQDLDTAWVEKADILRTDQENREIVKVAFDLQEPAEGQIAVDKVETDEGVLLVTVTGTIAGNASALDARRREAEAKGFDSLMSNLNLGIMQNVFLEHANIDRR